MLTYIWMHVTFFCKSKGHLLFFLFYFEGICTFDPEKRSNFWWLPPSLHHQTDFKRSCENHVRPFSSLSVMFLFHLAQTAKFIWASEKIYFVFGKEQFFVCPFTTWSMRIRDYAAGWKMSQTAANSATKGNQKPIIRQSKNFLVNFMWNRFIWY